MKQKNSFPPVKIAVLIDGGFFVKRFNSLYNKDRKMTGAQVADYLYTMAMKHVGNNNTLYRIFYYDCLPLDKKVHTRQESSQSNQQKACRLQFDRRVQVPHGSFGDVKTET